MTTDSPRDARRQSAGDDVMKMKAASDVINTETARDVMWKAPVSNSVSPSLLEPFPHQVAGQSLVFRYGADTICKSLIKRELRVYQTMPDTLKSHVPQYRGVVDIALNSHQFNQKDREEDKEDGEEEEERRRRTGGGGVKHPLTTQRHLNKVAKSQKEDNVYHFLLLENIVSNFYRPCVLDLKLGTRQHGDDAPSHKVRYQIDKCRSTTSALLGVRLCGMKVFQSATGNYVTVDKTKGRGMRENDFCEAMRHFLFDGRHIRRELIPILLLRFRKLEAAISDLPSFRFYSSSLLIVYDGRECPCRCNQGAAVGGWDRCSTELTNGAQEHRTREGSYRGECNGTSTGCVRDDDDDEDVSGSVCSDLTSRNGQDGFFHNSLGQERRSEQHHPDDTGTRVYPGRGHHIPNGQADKAARGGSSSKNTTRLFTHKHKNLPNVGGKGPMGINECGDDLGGCDECPVVENPASSGRNCSHKAKLSTNSENTAGHSPCQNEREARAQEEAEKARRRMCECCADLVDIRMVDFANTTHAGLSEDAVVYQGPDQGCLLGLGTLIDTFTDIYNDTSDG
ncbi:hypothetical protein ACOMHN_005745 [Nucella lapillus]